MNAEASRLMDLLAAGLSPARPDAPAPRAVGGDALRFDQLLRNARAGELSSGKRVTIAPGAGVELSDGQLTRIADAVDRAEAAGSKRALVRMDGRLLEVDIEKRTVLREVDLRLGDVVSNIDALVEAGSSQGPSAGSGTDQLAELAGSITGLNPSLLRVLAKIA